MGSNKKNFKNPNKLNETQNKNKNFKFLNDHTKEKLKWVLTGKTLYIGIIIRIIGLLLIFSLNMDLNDMNELIIYAIQRLFSGKNPYNYSYRYTLTIYQPDNTYLYHLGYPPVVLIIYSIVILYPEMWNVWDFNIILFILNVFFDFLCYYIVIEKGKRFSKVVMAIYWLFPLFPYADYVTFYSVIYLLVFLALVNIDDPLKSMLFIFLNVGTYHLMVLMFPVCFVYYFRNYKGLSESVESYRKIFEANENIKPSLLQSIKNALSPSTIKIAFKRGINDVKSKGKKVIKSMIIALIPVMAIILPFVIWDFKGFKYHLIDASSERYNLTESQGLALAILIILILFILISMIIQFLIDKKHIALIWLITANIITFFLLSLYLFISLNFSYPHYFALIIPFGFYLPIVCWYEFRYYRLERNKLDPSLKNKTIEKLIKKFSLARKKIN
ncbi:MAG: hypothetical protein ACTSRZ_18645 [Promethearchaeota archaeon]